MEPNGKSIRPTKKQQETLVFIEKFIVENGYSPSYREIMQGCNYNSVATVALHVNNLIKRGHLEKATKLIFAEFNISSIPIKTIIAFFLVRIPKMPSEKRHKLTIR